MSMAIDALEADELFESFDIEELDAMEIADGVALPEMGASSGNWTCCSSSSSSCC